MSVCSASSYAVSYTHLDVYKRQLLYGMNHVRYCKVDSFHDCVQGIMRVPDLKNHEMFVFGFCMYKQTLYFVEETNQIQLLMEHVKNDVYKNLSLIHIFFSGRKSL